MKSESVSPVTTKNRRERMKMAKNQQKKRVTPYEKAINYLSQAEYIDLMITEKREMIDNLRSIASSTSMSLTADKVQTSPGDKIGNITAKIVDLEKELNNDIDNFIDMKADIMRTIDQYVDNLRERRLLYRRYLYFEAVETAARSVGVSRRTGYYMHKNAVYKVARKFARKDT